MPSKRNTYNTRLVILSGSLMRSWRHFQRTYTRPVWKWVVSDSLIHFLLQSRLLSISLFNDHPLSCFFDVATSISCEWKGKKISLILFPKRESERITLESEKSIENKVIGKSWKIDWRIVFVIFSNIEVLIVWRDMKREF